MAILAHQSAVGHVHDAIGDAVALAVVGYQQDGRSVIGNGTEVLQDRRGVLIVQIACRFIGQDKLGLV